MIGLALVSFIAIIGASFKGTISSAIDNQIKADFVLSPKNFQGFSPEAATAVRKQLPGSTVVQFRAGQVLVNGSTEDVTGASANFQKVANVKLRPGFDRTGLRTTVAWSSYKDAEVGGKKVKAGQTLKVTFPKGVKDVTVAGIFTDKNALPGNGDYVLSLADWNLFNEPLDQFVLVLKPATTRRRRPTKVVNKVADTFGGISADNKAEFKDQPDRAVRPDPQPDVRAAAPGRVHRPDRHRQHARAVDLRADARDRAAARRSGCRRVQTRRMVRGEALDRRGVRFPARPRDRSRVRSRADRGALRPGGQLHAPGRPARRRSSSWPGSPGCSSASCPPGAPRTSTSCRR